ALLQMGITFTVYGSQEGTERIWPFDIIPRVVDAEEWRRIDRGLIQVVHDVSHDRRTVGDRVVPEEIVRTAASFRPQCVGLDPQHGIWIHITGTDLVRDSDGTFYVLEDNLRCPSG